jgi:1,6-anhydro-N-acetylmuramate kinase
MRIRLLAFAMIGVALATAGCNQSVTLYQPTVPPEALITEVLTGTVAAPVTGVFQNTIKTYSVGQGGGQVTVTLTSAVQTLPDGSVQPTVPLGVGAGTVTAGGICLVAANSYVAATPGAGPHLSGSLAAGTYCIQVSGLTGQVGPVAFSITVTHP